MADNDYFQNMDAFTDLDYPAVVIQQPRTNVMSVSSENRYTVKVPRGDTIYYATETSSAFQRTCFGSGRHFRLNLYDRTQQQSIQFVRRLACGTCTFWCYLQKMEVWIPPGDYIGTIKQEISFNMTPNFGVYNKNDNLLYRIKGPPTFGCLLGKAQNFQIYTHDGSTQIGSITHQWDQVKVSYNTFLQMPSNIQDNEIKALLIGSAFLLEYMFFLPSNKRLACRPLC
ncbi:unnamed protein product [Acanthoscelides obtectus]|uniref:Phospholipid scramblase n=1 Tax=Acanthoscelides obtectus TaxID=200917 RepID=A0A9P0KQE4_ACAOB|nr:unnamed protein product [Acanthoscelides obtectus]CAK1628609.1 Phospholipid scramblase 3 [Acanthoscelides obtectus]